MSKHPRKKKAPDTRIRQQRSNDRGIYAVIIMVGLLGLGLWYLISEETFPGAVIGFVLAVLGLINWSAFKAWRGMPMTGWQQSLARLSLHFVGYGTKGGKPVEAARGQDNAKIALMISSSISIVIVLLVTWLVLPQ